MSFIKNNHLILDDGTKLPLEVLESNAGFYIGTWFDGPYSRESHHYYPSFESAKKALDTGKWMPRI